MKNPKKKKFKDYYWKVDGVYGSYWLGKFINNFIVNGKKQLIDKEFKTIFIYIKLYFNVIILNILLEKMEKTKPLFGFKYILKAGKRLEFPIFLSSLKQRSKAVSNLAKLISNRKEWYLHQRVLNELIDLYKIKKHILLKKRDEEFREAIKNRFNLRYSY
jgi:ribosomal protein S7